MGRYVKSAQYHAKKIEHYYKHAGTAGYHQALDHWHELSELMSKAFRSKQSKGDMVVIQAIIEDVKPMMEEMKGKAPGQIDKG